MLYEIGSIYVHLPLSLPPQLHNVVDHRDGLCLCLCFGLCLCRCLCLCHLQNVVDHRGGVGVHQLNLPREEPGKKDW